MRGRSANTGSRDGTTHACLVIKRQIGPAPSVSCICCERIDDSSGQLPNRISTFLVSEPRARTYRKGRAARRRGRKSLARSCVSVSFRLGKGVDRPLTTGASSPSAPLEPPTTIQGQAPTTRTAVRLGRPSARSRGPNWVARDEKKLASFRAVAPPFSPSPPTSLHHLFHDSSFARVSDIG